LPPAAASAAAALTLDHDAALQACARGERFALRMLYEHEGRWLLGVVRRIVRDDALAEDVLQDAFLQVWQRAATFDAALGSGRGWIYTVVRHQALRAVRGGRGVETVAVDPEDLAGLSDRLQSATAPDGDDRGLDTAGLERCLDRLEERPRACVVHAYVDGYTHEQIATRLGSPLGSVKSWIRRSLLALRECLSTC
jgi:RNA polymerase sigma-70 factor (ECF subfamily)